MEISLSLIIFLIYSIITVVLIAKSIKWLGTYAYKLKVINRMKGLPVIPFIGNAHQIQRKTALLNQIYSVSREFKDEPLYRIWIGWHPVIVFHKADYLDILVTTAKNTEKSYEYIFLHPWLGTGLLTSSGDKWQHRRRLITPTFHFEILNDFLMIMNEQAQILVDVLWKLEKQNKEIDIFRSITSCALDIICESAMGQNVNAQMNSNSEYVQAVTRISEVVFERFSMPFHWSDFIYNKTKFGKEHTKCLKILHDFTKKVIKERSEEFEANNFASQKRIAFLDMLLKAKHEDSTITFDDIQEEVDTFMFEGHDTTAAAISWACHLIGSHPEVQRRIQKELDDIFGSSDRPITNNDLKELKYLDNVIKETLRLFPSVPFFGRTLSDDDVVAGFKIFKGATAVILPYMIHRDEKYYPDPEKFNPDRFLPENSKDRHPYAYIPFSAGRRNCIGQRFALMEEKVLLANIFRKFELKSLKTTEELKPVAELILRPSNGIPVELKYRY